MLWLKSGETVVKQAVILIRVQNMHLPILLCDGYSIWYDFCSTGFKIKHKIFVASGSAFRPPVPPIKNSGCTPVCASGVSWNWGPAQGVPRFDTPQIPDTVQSVSAVASVHTVYSVHGQFCTILLGMHQHVGVVRLWPTALSRAMVVCRSAQDKLGGVFALTAFAALKRQFVLN
jgi:hypothetical protein